MQQLAAQPLVILEGSYSHHPPVSYTHLDVYKRQVQQGAAALGARVFLPELSLCGDNAAMVAAQGYYEFLAGHTAQSNLNGLPTLGIDDESLDGPR